MSELIVPGVEAMPDVPESVESIIEEVAEPAVNYSEKTSQNLSDFLKSLCRMKKG